MPGVGVRTAIKILTIVGDGSAFPTAGHLAAYAGLAPLTRRSGSSVKGETRSHRGNRAPATAGLVLSDDAPQASVTRTEFANEFVNTAGTHTSVFSVEPLNVADGRDGFTPIDTTVRATAPGDLATSTHPLKPKFSQRRRVRPLVLGYLGQARRYRTRMGR